MSPTGRLLALALLLAGRAHAEDPGAEPVGEEEEDEGLPTGATEGVPLPVKRAVEVPTPRLYVGANVGAGFALAHFGPSVVPGLEAGAVLDRDGRIQPFLGVQYAESHATGEADAPAFPDGYTWTLALRGMTVAPGLRIRVLPWRERVSPELAAGPMLLLGDVAVSGSADGAPFPETRQTRAAGGGFFSAGLVGRLGPGQLEGHVTFSLVRLEGDLTGGAFVPSLTPSIGYRVSR